ncbi:MAG: hypothetical protein JRE64_04315 [Deltaproteobacteria bacterium]|nr:hypothetical protein [Deltaproteobacteria bacterium]
MYYVVIETDDETNAYLNLEIPDAIPKQYQLLEGVSRLDGWPEDVVFEFSKHRPEGMNLTDYFENSSQWLIISNRFRAVLEEFDVKDIEYLPVKIKNHKGRMASEHYWIANFLVLTEAVDRERSIFDDNPGSENGIFSFDKLVLREDILKSGPVIFSLKEEPMTVIARQDLVERIKEEGLTGVEFVETDNFSTLEY